ncbi:unnamed protein product [Cladocopium goreaui]|uniref:Uncharacterized protein n=1 Tax=Cladocopium goreaui TaxID=2562237 RepID=A0A9P1D6W1_9DINO|nr:unnamed protein product [Cladocopium goreaui]
MSFSVSIPVLRWATSLPTSPCTTVTRFQQFQADASGATRSSVPAALAAAALPAMVRLLRRRKATLRRITRCDDQDPLSGVPESAWPLLQRAEEAHPSFGWQQIAQGIQGWRKALENGHVWEEATWPEESLCQLWASTLVELELPRFTRRS